MTESVAIRSELSIVNKSLLLPKPKIVVFPVFEIEYSNI
jgi:hypothetical protein